MPWYPASIDQPSASRPQTHHFKVLLTSLWYDHISRQLPLSLQLVQHPVYELENFRLACFSASSRTPLTDARTTVSSGHVALGKSSAALTLRCSGTPQRPRRLVHPTRLLVSASAATSPALLSSRSSRLPTHIGARGSDEAPDPGPTRCQRGRSTP
jgi:hypothetical protein